MANFVTRRTTFGALGPMQDFVAVSRDPFGATLRWLKLPTGDAEARATRERRSFASSDVVLELVDLA